MLVKEIFRALRHRNFRIFIAGQGVSLTGTWMQQVAMGWLVYRLTGSALLLGTVAFLGQLPAFLFSPVAGVLADRYDKRKMLIVVQSLAMLQAFLLAALVLAGKIEIWHIVALGALLGFANAFDMPIRQSFMVEMLGSKEDLPNAIALNSSMVNAARIIGPSLGGIIVAAVGEGFCFLLNGLSFLAVLAALFSLDVKPLKSGGNGEGFVSELKAGYAYLSSTPPLRSVLLLLASVNLFGMSFQVLMPVYAKEALGGGPKTLGFLMGAMGLGALSGAVAMAARKRGGGLLRLLPAAALAFGLGVALLSAMNSLGAALLAMAFCGAAMMTQMTASNMTVQTIARDDMRGRLMAYYAMAFMGVAPLGSLYAGAAAHALGVRGALFLGGFACVAAGALFSIIHTQRAGKLLQ